MGLAGLCVALWLGVAGPSAPGMTTPSLVRGEVDTAHFRILYTEHSEGAARALGPVIELAFEQFRQTLGREWPGITEVRVGRGRAELEGLALPQGAPPAWAAALAYPAENIILLEAASLSDASGPRTLHHELSHVALGQLGGAWPRWFQEGLAMYLSGERYDVAHYATLFQALRQDRLLSFEDLTQQWPQHAGDVQIAYAQSVAFVGFLIDGHGTAQFAALLDFVRSGEPFQTAFGKAFHASLGDEETAWKGRLPRIYSWAPLSTTTSLVWGVAACLCVVAYLRVRAARARYRASLAAEEAAEDAAQRILAAEAETPDLGDPNDPAWRDPDDELTPPMEKPTLH